MKRFLPALLSVLLLAGCSSTPAAQEDDGYQSVYGEDSTSKKDTQSDKIPEQEEESPLHTCTWVDDDDTKEDIRIYGPSQNDPFTKVECIQYIPSKIDFENENKEDVDQYLEDVKDALIQELQANPDILDVTWEKGYVKLIFTCKDLKDVQSVHQGYLDNTVSYIYKTFSQMGGTTVCDGKTVEHEVPDISEFDGDMQTIRDWTEANRAVSQALSQGTMEIDAPEALEFMSSSESVSDLVYKWSQNYNILNDEQRQTFTKVKNDYQAVLIGD